MFSFGNRSKSKLVGVHPDLVKVMARAIQLTEIDFAITEGVRDIDRQQLLVKQGLSKTLNSKHLVQSDGYAHAVDVMACGVDDDWAKIYYRKINEAVQKAAKELGIVVIWGGNWPSFFDGPHFQLVG
jgi:peptidoglycan LD-endopeptidase CwlK